MTVETAPRPDPTVFAGRLMIGLTQGLVLYLLYLAFDDKTWPATNGLVFAPLVAAMVFVPLAMVQALGNVRPPTLVAWLLAATAVTAGFAAYDIWSGWPTETQWIDGGRQEVPRLLANAGTLALTAAFLFIAQALVVAADTDRKIIASYPTQFDIAWKQGLQLALAGLFVGIFWLLLFLGSALFKLIELDFLERLIEHRWFSIPATTLAIAAAFHITDGRSSLVRGARNLVLALFSWLLPLLVLIGAGFLMALFFTGLQALWNTRMATALLLAAAIWLVVLINAVYQDGTVDHRPGAVLQGAASIGGLLLIPLVALAAYAISLRVAQYGWTSERILAAASAFVAGTCAVGYTIAAVWRTWFKPLERWNFWVAVLGLAVIAAVLTPLADPARISVASQMARLESGKTDTAAFDFYYLHRDGGRFGKAALERLAASRNPVMAAAAKDALKHRSRWWAAPPVENGPGAIAKRIRMAPAGARLPASFLQQSWSDGSGANACLTGNLNASWSCHAVVKDLGGGRPEIVLIYASEGSYREVAIYHQTATGWVLTGSFKGAVCEADARALGEGRFTAAVPLQRDLVVGARRYVVQPEDGSAATSCR